MAKRYDMSKASFCGLFVARIVYFFDYIIKLLVMCFAVKICEWSGKWLVLFAVIGAIIYKSIFAYIYPRLIKPCFSKVEPLKNKNEFLENQIITLQTHEKCEEIT